jgi:hypothetical protein
MVWSLRTAFGTAILLANLSSCFRVGDDELDDLDESFALPIEACGNGSQLATKVIMEDVLATKVIMEDYLFPRRNSTGRYLPNACLTSLNSQPVQVDNFIPNLAFDFRSICGFPLYQWIEDVRILGNVHPVTCSFILTVMMMYVSVLCSAWGEHETPDGQSAETSWNQFFFFGAWDACALGITVLGACNMNWCETPTAVGLFIVMLEGMMHRFVLETPALTIVAFTVQPEGVDRANGDHLSICLNYNLLASDEETIDECFLNMYHAFMGNVTMSAGHMNVSAVLVSATNKPDLKLYEVDVCLRFRKRIYNDLYREGMVWAGGGSLADQLDPGRKGRIWSAFQQDSSLVDKLPSLCQAFALEFMVIQRVSRVLKKCGQYQDLIQLSQGQDAAFSYVSTERYGVGARPAGEPLFHACEDVDRCRGHRWDYTLVLDLDTLVLPGSVPDFLKVCAANPDRVILQPAIKFVAAEDATLYECLELLRHAIYSPITHVQVTLMNRSPFYGKGILNNTLYFERLIGSADDPIEIVPLDVLSHDTFEAAMTTPLYIPDQFLLEAPCSNYISWTERELRWNRGELILAMYFFRNTAGVIFRALQKFSQPSMYIPQSSRHQVHALDNLTHLQNHSAHAALRTMSMKLVLFAYLIVSGFATKHYVKTQIFIVMFLIIVFPKMAVTNRSNFAQSVFESILSIVQYTPESLVGSVRILKAFQGLVSGASGWIPISELEAEFRGTNPWVYSLGYLYRYVIAAFVGVWFVMNYRPDMISLTWVLGTTAFLPIFVGMSSMKFKDMPRFLQWLLVIPDHVLLDHAASSPTAVSDEQELPPWEQVPQAPQAPPAPAPDKVPLSRWSYLLPRWGQVPRQVPLELPPEPEPLSRWRLPRWGQVPSEVPLELPLEPERVWPFRSGKGKSIQKFTLGPDANDGRLPGRGRVPAPSQNLRNEAMSGGINVSLPERGDFCLDSFIADPMMRRIYQQPLNKTLDISALEESGMKVLSEDRAHQIAAGLRKFPCSMQEFICILRELRWESPAVTPAALEQALEAMPSNEEVALLVKSQDANKNAHKMLGPVEKLMLPLANMSRAAARVRTLCIAQRARACAIKTTHELSVLKDACLTVQGSLLLSTVIRLAAEVGNYIKYGSFQTSLAARAIDVKAVGSLLGLQEIKAGHSSALHFLCAKMMHAYPDLDIADMLLQELRPAVKAATIHVRSLEKRIRSFTRDLDATRAECQIFSRDYTTTAESREEYSGAFETNVEVASSSGSASGSSAGSGDEDNNKVGCVADVADVATIRGSARHRLKRLRQILEELNKLILGANEATVLQMRKMMDSDESARAGMREDGLPRHFGSGFARGPDVIFENLAEFIEVFRQHWVEVRAELPSFLDHFESFGLRMMVTSSWLDHSRENGARKQPDPKERHGHFSRGLEAAWPKGDEKPRGQKSTSRSSRKQQLDNEQEAPAPHPTDLGVVQSSASGSAASPLDLRPGQLVASAPAGALADLDYRQGSVFGTAALGLDLGPGHMPASGPAASPLDLRPHQMVASAPATGLADLDAGQGSVFGIAAPAPGRGRLFGLDTC